MQTPQISRRKPIAVLRKPFGALRDGTQVDLFTLKSKVIEVDVISYGGVIVAIRAPDRDDAVKDVVLGFSTLDEYVSANAAEGNPYFGAIIGRYANRIAGGSFRLNGQQYSLPVNNGRNTLHGGPEGFHTVVWEATPIENGVEFRYLSKHGESGFPGNLAVTVAYTLSRGALRIAYTAATDRDTVLNLTNHSYFNLGGEGDGDVLNHRLTLRAAGFTPVNSELIPTGKLRPVRGTPFDFERPTQIGLRISNPDIQLKYAGGYDHNWVLNKGARRLGVAAELYEPLSGRLLTVRTTEPGLQFYSGNFLDGKHKGKRGIAYGRNSGLCLETQHFPDSPNQPAFPSTVLKKHQRFRSVTTYTFSTRTTRRAAADL